MLSLLRREVIKDEINKDNFNYYFIKNDSELIGYLEMREDEGIFFISQFYILKEYRYKGYGKAAFNLAKDIVKSLKYKDVKIYPNKKDTVLLDILKSWGFYGYVKYIVYIGHDIHFDSIEMTYDLV